MKNNTQILSRHIQLEKKRTHTLKTKIWIIFQQLREGNWNWIFFLKNKKKFMYFLFFVLFQPPLLFDSSLFYSKFSLVPRIGAQYQKLYLFFILSLSPHLFLSKFSITFLLLPYSLHLSQSTIFFIRYPLLGSFYPHISLFTDLHSWLDINFSLFSLSLYFFSPFVILFSCNSHASIVRHRIGNYLMVNDFCSTSILSPSCNDYHFPFANAALSLSYHM